MHWIEQCVSTQDAALALSDAPSGAVVAARRQTGGRGRLGRRWHASAEQALTFSVILRPPFPPARYPLITVALGGGATLALRGLAGVQLGMKWPNDLVSPEGRKLGGILTEAPRLGGADPLVISGMGLNLLQSREDFPEELQAGATSLALLAPDRAVPSRETVLECVLSGFDRGYRLLLAGDDAGLEELWNEASSDRGQRARVKTSNLDLVGIVEGFSTARGVILRTDDGDTHAIPGELVSEFRIEEARYP